MVERTSSLIAISFSAKLVYLTILVRFEIFNLRPFWYKDKKKKSGFVLSSLHT